MIHIICTLNHLLYSYKITIKHIIFKLVVSFQHKILNLQMVSFLELIIANVLTFSTNALVAICSRDASAVVETRVIVTNLSTHLSLTVFALNRTLLYVLN